MTPSNPVHLETIVKPAAEQKLNHEMKRTNVPFDKASTKAS